MKKHAPKRRATSMKKHTIEELARPGALGTSAEMVRDGLAVVSMLRDRLKSKTTHDELRSLDAAIRLLDGAARGVDCVRAELIAAIEGA